MVSINTNLLHTNLTSFAGDTSLPLSMTRIIRHSEGSSNSMPEESLKHSITADLSAIRHKGNRKLLRYFTPKFAVGFSMTDYISIRHSEGSSSFKPEESQTNFTFHLPLRTGQSEVLSRKERRQIWYQ